MLGDNPMMLTYHCIAHNVALVTSQAASEFHYLMEYQPVLTGLFLFFKTSAKRCDFPANIQYLLNEPTFKVTEVHEVRWMDTYTAVKTMYIAIDSLITYFTEHK